MTNVLLHRLFNGLPLGYRLRRRWEWTRPFSLPSYTAGTPQIDGTGSFEIFLPLNSQTLGAYALEATSAVDAVLARLDQTDDIAALRTYYRTARDKFGPHWRYADLLSALWAAATLSPPKAYLEIGVRSGRSAALVGAVAPECAIYGFDLWTDEYAGIVNPGQEFVRSQLRAAGHTGPVTLVSGDSRRTVAEFLERHPDLYFDLITIDGDKSIAGVSSDYAHTLPRLKVGGIVVSDDIFLAPHLHRVWETVIRHDARYVSWEFADGSIGVGAAIRMSDGPPLSPAV